MGFLLICVQTIILYLRNKIKFVENVYHTNRQITKEEQLHFSVKLITLGVLLFI